MDARNVSLSLMEAVSDHSKSIAFNINDAVDRGLMSTTLLLQLDLLNILTFANIFFFVS